MVISDFDTLIDYLSTCCVKSEIRELVLAYGNTRCAYGIEYEGQKARDFYHKINILRGQRIKNTILNFDEANGAINLTEFTRFISGVEDELKEIIDHGDLVHSSAANDIWCLLINRVGDLKVDRRLLFSKEDE